MKPKLTVIGSCRVFTPVDLIARSGRIDVGHSNFDWFTHSSADAVQKMRIVNGDLALPTSYVPLVINELRKYKPSAHFHGSTADTDVFVVEVCSAQQYRHGGFALQQWRVRDALHGVITDPDAVEIAQAAERQLLKVEDIVSDLGVLKGLVGERPVLLVSHNMIARDDGSVPSSKKLLKKAIEEAAATFGFDYYDPTSDILDAGVDNAMKDLAHYTPTFEGRIGDIIVSRAQQLIR